MTKRTEREKKLKAWDLSMAEKNHNRQEKNEHEPGQKNEKKKIEFGRKEYSKMRQDSDATRRSSEMSRSE